MSEREKADYDRLVALENERLVALEYARLVALENARLVALTQARDWSTKPTYSKWVHDYTGAETPMEQVGIYTTFIGGMLYGSRYWMKSHHLLRAAQLPVGSEQRLEHQALGWLTEAEIQNATRIATRFRARGILAGIGFPVLWLAYIWNKKK